MGFSWRIKNKLPVHRHISNAPGRKIVEPAPERSALTYYCMPCDRKFNEAQAFSACPYCSGPLMAKVKETWIFGGSRVGKSGEE